MKLFSIEDEYRHLLINILGIKLRIRRGGYKKQSIPTELCGIPILSKTETNECIYNMLLDDKPCMITRFGSVEITTVGCYLDYRDKDGNCTFPKKVSDFMVTPAGFFSACDEELIEFSKKSLEICKNIDALGVWQYAVPAAISEEKILKVSKNDNMKLISFYCIGDDQIYIDNPWTRALAGKKVLVLHPFANTIEKQYKKKDLLFKNNLLPDFELITYKTVQGIDTENAKKQYGSWFNALDMMCSDISKIDFDIALIGAGAFGMFLANHIKNMGKKAVHVGGSLQLFFGITGSRWELDEVFNKEIKNEHWVRPSEDETVSDRSNFVKNEGNNAYW